MEVRLRGIEQQDKEEDLINITTKGPKKQKLDRSDRRVTKCHKVGGRAE